MSAKLSRSWSFFSGRRTQNNNDYLNQDYQQQQSATGGTPTSRVNLQQRFNQQEEKECGSSSSSSIARTAAVGWRQGPLPSPPTHQHHHGYTSSPSSFSSSPHLLHDVAYCLQQHPYLSLLHDIILLYPSMHELNVNPYQSVWCEGDERRTGKRCNPTHLCTFHLAL